jgi:hypothetical protein
MVANPVRRAQSGGARIAFSECLSDDKHPPPAAISEMATLREFRCLAGNIKRA